MINSIAFDGFQPGNKSLSNSPGLPTTPIPRSATSRIVLKRSPGLLECAASMAAIGFWVTSMRLPIRLWYAPKIDLMDYKNEHQHKLLRGARKALTALSPSILNIFQSSCCLGKLVKTYARYLETSLRPVKEITPSPVPASMNCLLEKSRPRPCANHLSSI